MAERVYDHHVIDGHKILVTDGTHKVQGPQESPGILMSIWVIYHQPELSALPWRCRRFEIVNDTQIRATADQYGADSLEMIRTCVPPGRAQLQPNEGDDPAIYETWI